MPAPSTFWTLAALMFATGIGIPLLATLNSQLGQQLASPAGATFVLFTVGTVLSALILLVAPSVDWSRLTFERPWIYFGVVFMVFYIISITYAAPRIGIGNAVFFVLLGAVKFEMTGRRAVGMAVMTLGVYLARRGG